MTKKKRGSSSVYRTGTDSVKNTAYCADSLAALASFNSSVCKIHLSL